MSYNPRCGIFARSNSATVSVPANTARTIELNDSIIHGSSFDGTNLSSDSNDIIVQCDVRFTYSTTFQVYFQCYWSGGAAEDRGRQVPPAGAGSLHARDEFWGLGSSLRPVASGLSATNATIAVNDCLTIGLVI